MTIVHATHERRFTQICNDALDDPRISFRAKGVLAYLLSKPASWKLHYQHLMTVGPEGKDAVLSALAELKQYGYLIYDRQQNERHQWTTSVRVVEEPEEPATGSKRGRKSAFSLVVPTPGLPEVGKPGSREPDKSASRVVGAPEVGRPGGSSKTRDSKTGVSNTKSSKTQGSKTTAATAPPPPEGSLTDRDSGATEPSVKANQWRKRCIKCGNLVEAGAGELAGKDVVHHLDDPACRKPVGKVETCPWCEVSGTVDDDIVDIKDAIPGQYTADSDRNKPVYVHGHCQHSYIDNMTPGGIENATARWLAAGDRSEAQIEERRKQDRAKSSALWLGLNKKNKPRSEMTDEDWLA